MSKETPEKPKPKTGEYLPLKHISFNQDGSHFVVLSKKGIHVFKVDPFEKIYEKKAKEVDLVEMVYSTNYLGYVINSKMQIFDVKQDSVLCEIPERRKILAIRFTQKYFILVFKDEADIYDRNHMEKKYWAIKTGENLTGVCCTSKDNDMFAVPSEKIGEVLICNLQKKTASKCYAHAYPIVCLSMNASGSIVATSSDNGRNIKLIDCNKIEKVRELRRGRAVQTMFSIAFSEDSKDLCCYSSSGTVHQFQADGEGGNKTSFVFPGYEWSKNAKSTEQSSYGKIAFDLKSSNVIYCVFKSGLFVTIDFTKEEEELRLTKKSLLMELTPTEEDMRDNSIKILKKFPDRVPVMLDLKNGCNLGKLPKRKYLVPKGLSVGNFGFSIAKKMGLSDQQLKFYVGDEEKLITQTDDSLNVVYQQHHNPDGFLYMKYSN